MPMTESLRKLLRKMGGSPSNGDNSDELVSKIADVYSGGAGGGLPAFTTADKGKVLSLADGSEQVTETVVLIQEQSVTTGDNIPQATFAPGTFDTEHWIVGSNVTLTINGTIIETTITNYGGVAPAISFSYNDKAYLIVYYQGDVMMRGEPSTTYAISAIAQNTSYNAEPKWENGVKLLKVNVVASEGRSEFNLDKTFKEIYAAYINKDIVSLSFPMSGDLTLNKILISSGEPKYRLVFEENYYPNTNIGDDGFNPAKRYIGFTANSDDDYPVIIDDEAASDVWTSIQHYEEPHYVVFILNSDNTLHEDQVWISDGRKERAIPAITAWETIEQYEVGSSLSRASIPSVFIRYSKTVSSSGQYAAKEDIIIPMSIWYDRTSPSSPGALILSGCYVDNVKDTMLSVRITGSVTTTFPDAETGDPITELNTEVSVKEYTLTAS